MTPSPSPAAELPAITTDAGPGLDADSGAGSGGFSLEISQTHVFVAVLGTGLVVLVALAIVIEAMPVASYLRAIAAGGDPGWSTAVVVSMLVVAALCAASTILPLRIGLRRLQELEL